MLDRRDHSALMLAARITLPHFSVSSAMLPKSAGEPGSAMRPNSANRALILGSAQSLVDLSIELLDHLDGCVSGRSDAPTRCLPRSLARIHPRSGYPAGPESASQFVTASGRSLPALIYSIDSDSMSNITCS